MATTTPEAPSSSSATVAAKGSEASMNGSYTALTHEPENESENDLEHIFTVAARSLQDCAELLQSLKAAVAEEEHQEQEKRHQQKAGVNGNHANGHHTNGHHTTEDSVDRGVNESTHATTGVCRRSEMYTKPSKLACQGTIGKHVRHLHDHYRLLLSTYPPNKGLSSKDKWSVDYDARSREVPMETDMDYAIKELSRLQHVLEECRRGNSPSEGTPTDLSKALTLHATIDPAHPPVKFQTTFGRELWFCSLHAVHHFAMIKVICGEMGMPVTENFGLAPSTIKHRH
ncbi:hypothetical protein BC939DRAFT_122224 [Gamsiella multidivaricata]|uniref:uncharacterized protein n=1 Tax=Gamsiella multidivaricata TaxID=101098 RepID=UPI0022207D4E|nr:uncharacterized protein BC939DRAFT_122224 [Gamsiella multidivaricata]KAG0361392.1 hypothetical protein BGZ54_009113 [Gamsiella multidivaricata]KAI7825657.1 hypothetical protein BC939DRAFT_122224 [Gamsiella multidivaricata]